MKGGIDNTMGKIKSHQPYGLTPKKTEDYFVRTRYGPVKIGKILRDEPLPAGRTLEDLAELMASADF